MFPTRVLGEILKKHKYMNCETDRVHKQRQAKRLELGVVVGNLQLIQGLFFFFFFEDLGLVLRSQKPRH